jgi:Tfp pilus assembly major pilin PilA
LRNPETGKTFTLYPAQIEFIRRSCTACVGPREGELPFAELVYSCPKKSGKTATAAMIVIYVIVVLGGPYAEGYCVANDFE